MDKRSSIARQLATLKNRDQVIREAFNRYGMTKQEIHELSGIARTTIDRILKEKHVPASKITATTDETGPSWERSIAAWIEAAQAAGHTAQAVEGETVNERNSAPVVLADGDHYVLTRQYDPRAGHTIVKVDYQAVKTEDDWVPTA